MRSAGMLMLCAVILAAGSGCAALSLFSQSHEHTHQHHYNECDQGAVNQRLAEIERHLGMHAKPSPDLMPAEYSVEE